MCKKTDSSQKGQSDQTNSNTNVGLINVSDQSQSFGITGEQIATYMIAFIVGLMVLKWIRKACNRRAARNRQMIMDMANNIPMNAVPALPPPAPVHQPVMQPVHQPVMQQPVVPIVLQHGGYKQQAPAIMMEADAGEFDAMKKYRT